MDAMILAAGLGTRLGPITRARPKALVEVAGVSALEHVARRLIAVGADRLIINVHHHADLILEHVAARGGFGVEVVFSRETAAPLETGGGLLHAAAHIRRDRPFFLHNVDVLSDADLTGMYEAHGESGALATLAVSRRESARLLLFDGGHRLCGRADARSGTREVGAPRAAPAVTDAGGAEGVRAFAFAGIHVISPPLLDRITETGAFSIMDVYLRLAAAGERIAGYDIGGALWLEIGTPERLAAARRAAGDEAAASG
jgi:NDP-sugar pyrophosphorylase family protein